MSRGTVYATYRNLGNWGALGNQLWQIAGIYGYAMENGLKPRFPKWFYEPYFRVPAEFFVDELPDGVDGGFEYFQDLRYFLGNEMYIHEFFLPSIFAVEKMKENGWDDIKNEDSITAIHVRRGNTLNQPLHHPVRSVAYFEEALDILKPKQLAVFSDDLDWCKQQSVFRDAWFGPGNPPHLNLMVLEAASPMSAESVVIDFHLMAGCSNFVISNSTFGWWAAWVSTYFSGETVVYPKDWYGPLVEADYTLMIPQSRNWIGI